MGYFYPRAAGRVLRLAVFCDAGIRRPIKTVLPFSRPYGGERLAFFSLVGFYVRDGRTDSKMRLVLVVVLFVSEARQISL